MTGLFRSVSVLFMLISIFTIIGCGGGPGETSGDAAIPDNGLGDVDLTLETPLLRVGYCNHDHHSAVFVSARRGEAMRDLYGIHLVPMGERFYALVEDGRKVLEIEFVQSQGAINVPNNMVAGLFDIAFGGVIAFATSADQGSGVQMISPLHSRGDMLVVAADNNEVTDWESFMEWACKSEEPVVIGYKSPSAVALLIFQAALTEEGVSWSMHGNPEPDSDILLFNAQGEPNLNPSLQNGTIHGYVSNNPACAMAEHNGIGKCVAELSDLPPGDFIHHPCCAIASTSDIIASRPEEIAAALRLFSAATDYICEYPGDAAEAAAEWIGNPAEVELASMATSGYSMRLTDDWLNNMELMIDNVRELGAFTGPLSEKDAEASSALLYDFSLLPRELR